MGARLLRVLLTLTVAAALGVGFAPAASASTQRQSGFIGCSIGYGTVNYGAIWHISSDSTGAVRAHLDSSFINLSADRPITYRMRFISSSGTAWDTGFVFTSAANTYITPPASANGRTIYGPYVRIDVSNCPSWTQPLN